MEKLEPAARKYIEKINTDRLRMKLAVAGVNEEEVTGMSREQLMHAWAEIVAAGGEKVAGKAEAQGWIGPGTLRNVVPVKFLTTGTPFRYS
jgi:predicted PhzF superfamily epimerase YddE/YHI9